MQVTLILLLFGVVSQAFAVQTRYVRLTAGRDSYDPVNVADYYRDRTGKLTIADVRSLAFKPLHQDAVNFGYTTDKFWLKFGVVNQSARRSRWALRTFVRFMRPLELFISHNGGPPQRVLYNDQNTPFGRRPENIRHLAVIFSLPRGSRDVFYVKFGAGGTAALPMEITTPQNMAAEQARVLLQDVVFVAVLATLTLFNLFHYFAVRARAYLFYGIQATGIALYMLHMDGFAFQYLWPNSPHWNSIASPVLGDSVQIGAMLFSIAFLRSREYTPRYYRWLIAVLLTSAVNLALCFFLPDRVNNQIGLAMNFVIAASLLPHAIYVVRKGHLSARYYLLGWTFMLTGVAVYAARMLGIVGHIGTQPLADLKVTVLLEALSLAFGLADQHRRLHIRTEEMQQQLVDGLKTRLEEARERIQLEHEREATIRALLIRSQQLAATSHDINQPIHSLRLAVNALSPKIDDPATVNTLNNALEHMGDVLNAALTDARRDMQPATSPVVTLTAGQLLNEVAETLKIDARERGIRIRAFDSDQVFTVSRLPLKRCLMNLVSNAIEHSRGSVLLGVRSRGSRLALQVIDNGIGLSQEQRESLLAPWRQGEQSRGYGLGLAIVQETCKEYDWQFDVESTPGKGSRFSICVPRIAGDE